MTKNRGEGGIFVKKGGVKHENTNEHWHNKSNLRGGRRDKNGEGGLPRGARRDLKWRRIGLRKK